MRCLIGSIVLAAVVATGGLAAAQTNELTAERPRIGIKSTVGKTTVSVGSLPKGRVRSVTPSPKVGVALYIPAERR